MVELTRLLAEVPAGAVALDTEAPRARKLDRIEALMVVNHGATVAWSRSGGEIEMAGIAAHSEFGRVALFRAWLRAACLAIAAEIPA